MASIPPLQPNIQSHWPSFFVTGGAARYVSDTLDTAVSNPAPGDVLSWNGAKWVNAPDTSGVETASNVGGGSAVFKQKVASDFEFRTLIAGSANLKITQNADDVTLDVRVGTEAGKIAPVGLSDLQPSEVMVTDVGANPVSEARGTAFNRSFGESPGDVVQIGSVLGANAVVETSALGKLITSTKQTGHNLALGTTAGTVSEGNHGHQNFGYGSIYCYGASVAETSHGTPGTFTKISAFTTDGPAGAGVTPDVANDQIIVSGAPGRYRIGFTASLTAGPSSDYWTFVVYVDGAPCYEAAARCRIPTADQENVAGGECFHVFDGSPHTIDLRIACSAASKQYVVAIASVNVSRFG